MALAILPASAVRFSGRAFVAVKLRAAFDHFENQSSRIDVRFPQRDLYRFAQRVGQAAVPADQSVLNFVVIVIIVRQRADRDQSVGADLVSVRVAPDRGGC